jgi:hypothetical protein
VIRVTFACGHSQPVGEMVKDPPCCRECGERRVQNVKAPKPRFSFLEAAPVALKE